MAPVDESAVNMQRCLREKGWDVELSGAGGFTVALAVEQEERFNADHDECLARFGYDKPPPPLTQQEAEELYAKLLTVADCVRNLGYKVPEPPSEQAFVAHMMRSPIPPWHPYRALYAARDFEGLVRVQQDCPAR